MGADSHAGDSAAGDYDDDEDDEDDPVEGSWNDAEDAWPR